MKNKIINMNDAIEILGRKKYIDIAYDLGADDREFHLEEDGIINYDITQNLSDEEIINIVDRKIVLNYYQLFLSKRVKELKETIDKRKVKKLQLIINCKKKEIETIKELDLSNINREIIFENKKHRIVRYKEQKQMKAYFKNTKGWTCFLSSDITNETNKELIKYVSDYISSPLSYEEC